MHQVRYFIYMGVKTVQYRNFSFVNIENPSETEIKYLRRYYPFHPLNLEDYVTKTQRPKIEEYRHYVLVVLDFPYFKSIEPENGGLANILMNPPKTLQRLIAPKKEEPEMPEKTVTTNIIERLYLSEASFFIGNDYLVVLHEGNLPPINHLFERCQRTLAMRKKYMETGIPFLFYSLVDSLVDYSLKILDKTNSDIENVDRKILTLPNEEVVAKISLIRRNVVLFHTMIKPTIPLFQSLGEGKVERLNKELTQFWANLLNHANRIVDGLDDARELVEGISTSTESVLSLRTNQVIKVLTVFSAVLLTLSFITGIYGMNIVGLPLAQDPFVLSFIILAMLAIILFMLLFFRLRRWL